MWIWWHLVGAATHESPLNLPAWQANWGDSSEACLPKFGKFCLRSGQSWVGGGGGNANNARALSIHLMMINAKQEMTICLPSMWQNQTTICEERRSLPGRCSLLAAPLLSHLCFSKWRGKCAVIQHLFVWKGHQWRDKLVWISHTHHHSKH